MVNQDWYEAEQVVRTFLISEKWEPLRLFHIEHTEKGGYINVFNWEEISERNPKIARILYAMNKEGYHLPDFVCFRKSFAKFVEVKNHKRIRSVPPLTKKQSDCFNRLAELGFGVEVYQVSNEKDAEGWANIKIFKHT